MQPDMNPSSAGGWLHHLLMWLAGNGYAPHCGCFLGDTVWVRAYVAANWVISLAYVLIALLIAQRMRRAAHIPKTLMGNALLGIFVTCAGGHFLAGLTTIAWPGYRLETLWHWVTVVPAWLFLAHHNKFSLIVEGPHMIAETREELSRKNGELSALYEQVKQVDRLKSEFFANVSHELRTPLALIIGPIHTVLGGDNLTDAQRHDLEVAARNARTVLKHVNDLLDISRMEADKMGMHYVETDLAQLTRVIASHFESVTVERQQTLALETPAMLPAQVDADKVERVLLNLLSNAVKFTPTGGHIVCRLYAQDADAVLEVRDNGPGIPADMREAVFERFRQVDGGAARRHEGTGLGLAIVKDFIELHGGGVRVTEAEGGGALFHLTLPLFAPVGIEVMPTTAEAGGMRGQGGGSRVSESVEAALRGNNEAVMVQTLDELRAREEAEAIVQESGQPLVLVVEDNREMSHYIAQALAPRYRAEIAHDGEQGLKRALELRPDLILSDIMMPNKSGDEMVADIRAHEQLDDIPIVLLTAKADDELRIRLLANGAQDYLMKPFAPEELQARVGNLVSIKRARQSLQTELASRQQNLESLADEITSRKRALQSALEEARTARMASEQARSQAVSLQQEVTERNVQLTAAILEAHHRIKNNLQIVSSLLEMQIDGGPPALPLTRVRAHLRQIKAIALVHNLLRRDSDYSEVDAAQVLESLVSLLQFAGAGVARARPIRLQTDTLLVHAKVATALALIINELVGGSVSGKDTAAGGVNPPADSAPDRAVGEAFSSPSLSDAAASVRPAFSQSVQSVQSMAQESGVQNVIFIRLQRFHTDVILSIENPEQHFAPDFDVFRDGDLGLELVTVLVESDLQGEIRFGSAAAEPGADERQRARPAAGRIEIRFPERPNAA